MAAVLDLTNRPRHTGKARRFTRAEKARPDSRQRAGPAGYFETPRIVRANGLHTTCAETTTSSAQRPAMTKKIRGERR
jgi:hypothetical protein